MTRNNSRMVVLALALGVSAVAGAHAQGWGGHRDHRLFGLLEGVTLSDAQQQQIHADIKAGFEATRTTRQALHALNRQIASTMLSSGSVSQASIMPLVQQQEQLRAQLDQERVAVALQIRGVLTASQLAQAAQAHGQLAALHEQEQAIEHPGEQAQ